MMFASREETISASQDGERAAVLFVDTFNGVFEHQNALAAARVLNLAGYKVHTLMRDRGHHCCGRTYLSVGMVERAKSHLRALIDELLPFAKAGVAVVGLEPSCLLTLRDEALVMRLGDDPQVVAAQALLFEEFIAREVKAGRFNLALKPAQKPFIVHGHCHQKAFDALSPILDVLRLIPGATVEPIEGSCCGMAGSFGYEPGHYELSMRMAEASLLPAVREHPEAIVVADGTSCRQQIAHGTRRKALHVARVLEQHLTD